MNKPEFYNKIYKLGYLTEFDDIKYNEPNELLDDELEYLNVTYGDNLRKELEYNNGFYFFNILMSYVGKKYNFNNSDEWNKELDIALDYLLPILKEGKIKMRVSDIGKKKYLNINVNKNTLKNIENLDNLTEKEKQKLINRPILPIHIALDKLTRKEIRRFVKEGSTLEELDCSVKSKVYTKETSQKGINRIKKIWNNLKTDKEKQNFEMFYVKITLLGNKFDGER